MAGYKAAAPFRTAMRLLNPQQVKIKGYTIVPLQVYFKKGRVKVEIGLGRGKKLYDKRIYESELRMVLRIHDLLLMKVQP